MDSSARCGEMRYTTFMVSRLITTLLINTAAFLLTAYLLPGFSLDGNIVSFVVLIAVFTLINTLIRPIIKLILSPLIFITFGLFSLVINAGILYLVDIYSAHISIDGLITLGYATIIITLVNVLLGGPAKLLRRKTI